MRQLRFKLKYEFKLNGGGIVFNPVDRIKQGYKIKTCRLKQKLLTNYRVVQGSYYKPIIHTNFYLLFYKEEKRSIASLTSEEIKVDLGLTNQEFDFIKQYQKPREFFLAGIRKINRNSAIQINDKLFLYDFDVIWNNQKNRTLESFLNNNQKKVTEW